MPKVTVLMPVYNAEPYLREAIDSILSQTFTDFEFLIIDDGSTDGSRDIVDSYDDMRIVTAPNAENEGLVASLNKGIELADGSYIAIMHADDICMPDRLERQVARLDENPDVSLVAAKAVLIDEAGVETGYWQLDQLYTHNDQIRDMLPRTNCIVHPSVMIRRSVARVYRYDGRQHATEDYDLWLRLAADNHRIEKIDGILVKYRVHTESITAKSNAKTGEYKEVRARFLFGVKAFTNVRNREFLHKVWKNVIADAVKISVNTVKVKFLSMARETFISIGKQFGSLYNLTSHPGHGVLFFISFSLKFVGGAERVHADLVSCHRDKLPWVVLANEWHDESKQSDQTIDYRFSIISSLLSNPFSKNLLIGFFAGYINSSKCVAFGGNSGFFYSLIPYLDSDILCVDFIHGFGSEIEIISLPFVPRINRRIVIAEELCRDLALLYKKNGVPDTYMERIRMVDYGVTVPSQMSPRIDKEKIDLFYVGRGTEEKRVYLVGHIARIMAAKGLPVAVSLVGNVQSAVEAENLHYCTFYGEISDTNVLENLYKKADLLVITSRTEGLSLVKMEAMAHGVVPIAVAVGGIPAHIKDGVTGFLVSPDQSEESIVVEFCTIIENLANNRGLIRQVSSNAYEFARSHFDRDATLSQLSKIFDYSQEC